MASKHVDPQDAGTDGELLFRTLVQNAPVGIFLTDVDGNCQFVNEKWCELVGVPPASALGAGWSATLHPNDRERVLEEWYSAARHGQPFQTDTRFVTPEGRVRWLNGSTVILRNSTGEVAGHVGRLIDVNDRKRAEEALRESEQRYRNLFESMDEGYCIIEMIFDHSDSARAVDYRFIEVNPAFEAQSGMKDATGKRMLEFVPSIEEHWLANYGHVALTGEPIRFANEYKTLHRWFDVFAFRVGEPEQHRVAVLFTDITARKNAQAKAHDSEQRMRLLWEAAAVLLTTDEPDSMLKQLFAKIGPHLQLDAYFNFMVSESGDRLRLASCAGIADEVASRIEYLEFGQAVCGTVAVCKHPIVATCIHQSDEPMVQLVKTLGIRSYACNPLMAGNQLLGTLSFASRSRETFRTEELEFLETICKYVAAAYERLRLIGELRESDRRKDEFLATLAHELRNPLAPIRNGLQVMKLAGTDPLVVENARGMMERQLKQMVRLIDDLMDLSRISRGKITLRSEQVLLSAVIHNAVETSRPIIEAAEHQLTIDAPSEAIHLHGDATRLAQILANLLNNAAKYTERAGQIRLTVERVDNDVVMSVKDSGIGIPASMLPRVFEMFLQVDKSLEQAQGGLGIGLSIVKQLVELHGGRIEAHSAGLGQGSTFVVRLPLPASTPQFESHVLGDATASGNAPLRILVVDDNRDAAVSLAMLLRLKGNDTQTAHDGLDALDVARAFQPQLIFLDIGMPNLNGYEAARRIREEPWARDVVLAALTGWGQEADKRRAIENGFNAHLVKPIDPIEIEKLLTSLRK